MSRLRLLPFLLAAVALTACGALATNSHEQAMADARDAGITPYWLGNDLKMDTVQIEIGHDGFHDGNEGLGTPYFGLTYWVKARGGGKVRILTFSEGAGGWDVILDGASTIPGASVVEEEIGTWRGERWTVLYGTRPVNSVMYLLRKDDTVILAMAHSSTTGVPETDANPLVNAKLFRRVLEEHLQPYPE